MDTFPIYSVTFLICFGLFGSVLSVWLDAVWLFWTCLTFSVASMAYLFYAMFFLP